MSTPRYICIHGHFYQPPRENAWLEAIELQDSADPYHDWNERITAECYAANALSRILDGEDRIVRIVNNYSRISFNCGPTLLSWMEKKAPEVYEAILQADRESAKTFSGHGSAMAQPYNHMILPLANRRDKVTQVRWGLRDFRRRFGRDPEGMWLPETAADTESLEVLAEHGLRFTVLAPSQARAIRRKGEEAWNDLNGGGIDPSRAYDCPLPSGRRIAIFFYDGPISRAVAFEQLLSKGEHLANRLLGAFNDAREWPQLVHIATDGETYGHHHRHGDMALAYALHYIESQGLARLTNYGEYLEKHPPDHEVQIHESSSWSCVHGVERWRSDCGCNTGGNPGWNQAWRGPLRGALDWLRDELASPFEKEAGRRLKDPWAAREEYVEVILDRSPDVRERFLARHLRPDLPSSDGEKLAVWKLLELQRHALLMYTSCGWFFDELSGIETVQVIEYAARALQLAQELFGRSFEEPFLQRLDRAKSNIPDSDGGRSIYERFVKPAMVDHFKVGGHYAVSSIFRKYANRDQVYCFTVDRKDLQLHQAGEARLALGTAEVMSRITGETALMSFGVLHWGDHNLNGGVRGWRNDGAYEAMCREVGEAFAQADFPEVIRRFDKHFGMSTYSLRSLFKDEQRAILDQILKTSHEEAQATYRQLYERRAPMMRFLTSLSIPLPRAFRAAAEFVVNAYLREAFESGEPDFARIASLLEQARQEGVSLDREPLSFVLTRTIERLVARCAGNPTNVSLVNNTAEAVAVGRSLPFELDLWKAQNAYFSLREEALPPMQEKVRAGDEVAREWREAFLALGDRLGFRRPDAA